MVFILLKSILLISLLIGDTSHQTSPFTNTELVSFYSPSRDQEITFVIFTPPGYDKSEQRYPVLYFLHGRSGNHFLYWGAISHSVPDADGDAGAWISRMIQEGIIPPMIIVTPDDADGMWGEINETMITRELVEYVDSHWRTIPGRTGRAIEGFSMGGMGASRYAARHPDLYCSTIIMAAPGVEPLIEDWENNRAAILENDLKVRLVVGSEDDQLEPMTGLHEDLNLLEILHDFVVVPGVGHDLGMLYNAVGVPGLQFHGACFRNLPPTETHHSFLPGIIRHYVPY